ncbi:hypothetical protein GTE54_000190 [Salmonella enterica subsp. enterica]|nr:hypothetical protein [Salmonella enterica subsp. enterica]
MIDKSKTGVVVDTVFWIFNKPTKAMKHGFWRRQDILKELFRHLKKDNTIDCINYLAFMQANGWRTELPAQEHASE